MAQTPAPIIPSNPGPAPGGQINADNFSISLEEYIQRLKHHTENISQNYTLNLRLLSSYEADLMKKSKHYFSTELSSIDPRKANLFTFPPISQFQDINYPGKGRFLEEVKAENYALKKNLVRGRWHEYDPATQQEKQIEPDSYRLFKKNNKWILLYTNSINFQQQINIDLIPDLPALLSQYALAENAQDNALMQTITQNIEQSLKKYRADYQSSLQTNRIREYHQNTLYLLTDPVTERTSTYQVINSGLQGQSTDMKYFDTMVKQLAEFLKANNMPLTVEVSSKNAGVLSTLQKACAKYGLVNVSPVEEPKLPPP